MTEREQTLIFSQVLEDYIRVHHLKATGAAFPAVQALMSGVKNMTPEKFASSDILKRLNHGLSISTMLVSLNLPLSDEDIDFCLAASLCHTLPKQLLHEAGGKALWELLNSGLFELVTLVSSKTDLTEKMKEELTARIQDDRLAILVVLADWADSISSLYDAPAWRVHQYINDTRRFIFPLCVYAKGNYPEIYRPVSILMEKMRSLIEVNEILLNRYEEEQNAMAREILYLKEENARIRTIIRQLREEQV